MNNRIYILSGNEKKRREIRSILGDQFIYHDGSIANFMMDIYRLEPEMLIID